MIEAFHIWVVSKREELDHVFSLLGQRMSDEPIELIQDLTEAESWAARCGVMLAEAQSHLDHAIYFYMPKKEAEGQAHKTEAERKAEVDDKVREIREMRNRIESLCDALKQRISLGQSVLSFHRQFADAKLVK